MKEYVMLFEQFKNSLNEAKVKPFLDFEINKDDIKNQLKKQKIYWIKKEGWYDWKKITFVDFVKYALTSAIKFRYEGDSKPKQIQSLDFKNYQLTNVDPKMHEGLFDDKGKLIKVSRKSLWTIKNLKKEIKSMSLKDYNDSEAIDMLVDFINTHQGTLEWINKKAGEKYDELEAADWLYNQFV